MHGRNELLQLGHCIKRRNGGATQLSLTDTRTRTSLKSLAGSLLKRLGVCTSMALNNNIVYHTSVSLAALFTDAYIEPPGPYIFTSPS